MGEASKLKTQTCKGCEEITALLLYAHKNKWFITGDEVQPEFFRVRKTLRRRGITIYRVKTLFGLLPQLQHADKEDRG